jgi:choline/glycine/proline betaine transport protein
MTLTFFHWGLHAWAIYAIVALLLGTSPTATACR